MTARRKPHKFRPDATEGRCTSCWCLYHCAVCGTGMMTTHEAEDEDGAFLICEDEDRAALLQERVLYRLGYRPRKEAESQPRGRRW